MTNSEEGTPLWRGKRFDSLSKSELLQALTKLSVIYKRELEWHQRTLSMWELSRTLRARRDARLPETPGWEGDPIRRLREGRYGAP